MDDSILEKAQSWAEDPQFDDDFRNEISELINHQKNEELIDRFYKDLEFGTGGLRGIIGAGSNRMNIYTVRRATQGLADYLNEFYHDQGKKISVVIAHDSRNFSDLFTKESARVLAGNGIHVHVFSRLAPTPLLSFTVRELKAQAGIVITASHNPPEYNGYKVSWADGSQVISPHDIGIINKVNSIVDFYKINLMGYQEGLEKNRIVIVPKEIEKKYLRKLAELSFGNLERNKSLGIVYTPLHGAGNQPVKDLLRMCGFESLRVVPEQEKPDGDFPTVSYPNPEELSALKLAIKTAKNSDQLILATDPDADRLGVMVRHQGEWVKLSGNQIGQLMLDYYLRKLKENDRLPPDGVYITTIVTSNLGKKIAAKYGIKTFETLTGFKYIGSLMRQLEEEGGGSFIFGTEESHGYLFGDFIRDKDGVMAAMIFSELTAELYEQGRTPMDRIEELHREFGFHSDSLVSKTSKGHEGAGKIALVMSSLRKNPFKKLAGVRVIEIRDYLTQEVTYCQKQKVGEKIELPVSNVIAFYMEDGSRITVRPSGTEPKIKFYFNLCGKEEELLKQRKIEYEEEFENLIENFI
ncbi:MAG: phospho-sugar mutase [Deltaproteobacteria bacterium]|nr:phospho-sugar mutase [Deltaproteobacteria bacterium]